MPTTEFHGWDPKVPLNPGALVGCPKPVTGARADEELRRRTIAIMERGNIIGVTSGPQLAAWQGVAPSGMGQRIMFGSDQMVLPEAIEAIETATFLTPQGKRGIYYENARKFLRLDRSP